jgi:hypothetical protein
MSGSRSERTAVRHHGARAGRQLPHGPSASVDWHLGSLWGSGCRSVVGSGVVVARATAPRPRPREICPLSSKVLGFGGAWGVLVVRVWLLVLSYVMKGMLCQSIA